MCSCRSHRSFASSLRVRFAQPKKKKRHIEGEDAEDEEQADKPSKKHKKKKHKDAEVDE